MQDFELYAAKLAANNEAKAQLTETRQTASDEYRRATLAAMEAREIEYNHEERLNDNHYE